MPASAFGGAYFFVALAGGVVVGGSLLLVRATRARVTAKAAADGMTTNPLAQRQGPHTRRARATRGDPKNPLLDARRRRALKGDAASACAELDP
jgi:hypothetical protein